ncbi:MAG: extracellular solute-binding protein [Opitutae bacterium]|nr:extracellular solute-binding protein [Opitutae bacterium]
MPLFHTTIILGGLNHMLTPWSAGLMVAVGAVLLVVLFHGEFRRTLRPVLSPGSAVIVALALAASLGVAFIRTSPPVGMPFWVYSDTHFKIYQPLVAEWNRHHPDQQVAISQLHLNALERRMLSGFLAGTPVSDIMAVERPMAAKTFTGPLESVGFIDLTDRLRREQILPRFAPTSLTPWTNRGRIFGVPLDVHPVLLAYHADLVEAAGIDVSKIETWDDYFRMMRPLMRDLDGNGRPDRWLLNLWDTNVDLVLMLLQQAGGDLFDAEGHPGVNLPKNAEVVARVVTWIAGPGRVCTDIDLYSASGHQQRVTGVVVGELVPDWMAGKWKIEIPALAGKLKLMPLPAWERGGRRTSVWHGGTMLGITKAAPDPDKAWAMVRHLALSPVQAERLFRRTNLVPPNRALWSLPVFDEPDPYYCGQPIGRLFLNQVSDVPPRSSSPYFAAATGHFGTALVQLRAYADRTGTYDAKVLQVEAQRLLDEAQRRLTREMSRNTFLTATP